MQRSSAAVSPLRGVEPRSGTPGSVASTEQIRGDKEDAQDAIRNGGEMRVNRAIADEQCFHTCQGCGGNES